MAELNGLKCSNCSGSVLLPPTTLCPACGSLDLEATRLSGSGSVFSYTRVEVGSGKFGDRVPFVISLIDLDEGPRATAHVVNPSTEDACDVLIGDRVAFSHHDDLGVPIFEVTERP